MRLLGCYLVLRRMSLLGDALSHAVLPGLVVAYVLAGSLNIAGMFIGALCVGLLTTFLTQALHRQGGVPADASMGVVFTSLFALGVILIKRDGQGVDLDPDCVLYGQIEYVELNTVMVWGYELPRALMSIGPVMLVDLAVILVLWKELKLSSFDPALATTMGYTANLLHYLLMALVRADDRGFVRAGGFDPGDRHAHCARRDGPPAHRSPLDHDADRRGAGRGFRGAGLLGRVADGHRGGRTDGGCRRAVLSGRGALLSAVSG